MKIQELCRCLQITEDVAEANNNAWTVTQVTPRTGMKWDSTGT